MFLPLKPCTHLSYPHTCHMPCPSHSSWFSQPNNVKVRSTEHKAPRYVVFTIISSLLGPNILPSTLFSLHSSLNVSGQVSHPDTLKPSAKWSWFISYKFWPFQPNERRLNVCGWGCWRHVAAQSWQEAAKMWRYASVCLSAWERSKARHLPSVLSSFPFCFSGIFKPGNLSSLTAQRTEPRILASIFAQESRPDQDPPWSLTQWLLKPDLSPPSSAKINNGWSNTSTPRYAFMARTETKIAKTRLLASSRVSDPSAWDNTASTERIFMKFGIWGFFENMSGKLKFN